MNKLLTVREKEVFELLTQNKSTKDIASILRIIEKTVRNHVSNVIQKLGAISRSGAILELIKLGNIKL